MLNEIILTPEIFEINSDDSICSRKFLNYGEKFDPLYGMDAVIEITEDDLHQLRQGKVLYCGNIEYCQLIRLKPSGGIEGD